MDMVKWEVSYATEGKCQLVEALWERNGKKWHYLLRLNICLLLHTAIVFKKRASYR